VTNIGSNYFTVVYNNTAHWKFSKPQPE